MSEPQPFRLRAKGMATRYFANPIARFLLALHISPNAMTLAGLGVSGVAAWLISDGNFIAGGAVMLGGSIADVFDGAMARLSGKTTVFGAFLDSSVDRLQEAAILFGILVFYLRDGHTLGVYLAFAALTASFMVSYLRARAEGLGLRGDVGFLTRPERVVVLGVGLLAGYPQYASALVAVVGGFTVLQRAVHVYRTAED